MTRARSMETSFFMSNSSFIIVLLQKTKVFPTRTCPHCSIKCPRMQEETWDYSFFGILHQPRARFLSFNGKINQMLWAKSESRMIHICKSTPCRKLEFGGFVEWDTFRMFVGNGFIRSERWVNIPGSLDGNGFLFSTFFHSTYHPQIVTGRNG